MANQSLAVKYRPNMWDAVIGQPTIVDILKTQAESGKFSRTILLCGPAGCGKTTLARIFAKAINNGKGTPIEIDGASNNGVDNVRDIIDRAQQKALDAEYKCFIIDECHSLSNNAWQAFLKTIEEPPAKSVFLFCTTDPQKIPNTILSRVQRFDIKRISFEDIVSRLKFIIKSENITNWEEPAVEYIAKIGDGGMRESISLLQKALSYSKNLTVDNTIKALGIIDYSVMFDLINAIYDGEESTVIDIIEKQYRDGADLKQFIKQFTLFLLDIRKYSLFNSTKYISIPDTYLPELKKYIKETDEKVNKMFLDQVNELNSSIKWETVVKPLIELKLLMLCK